MLRKVSEGIEYQLEGKEFLKAIIGLLQEIDGWALKLNSYIISKFPDILSNYVPFRTLMPSKKKQLEDKTFICQELTTCMNLTF